MTVPDQSTPHTADLADDRREAPRPGGEGSTDAERSCGTGCPPSGRPAEERHARPSAENWSTSYEILNRLASLVLYADEVHQASIKGESVQGRAQVLAKQLRALHRDLMA